MKMTEQFSGAELTIIENEDEEKPMSFLLKKDGKSITIALTLNQLEDVTDAIVYGCGGRKSK